MKKYLLGAILIGTFLGVGGLAAYTVFLVVTYFLTGILGYAVAGIAFVGGGYLFLEFATRKECERLDRKEGKLFFNE